LCCVGGADRAFPAENHETERIPAGMREKDVCPVRKAYLYTVPSLSAFFKRKTGKLFRLFRQKTAGRGPDACGKLCCGYLYSFDRMDFQQMGKQDNAGRFERGYLKVTTENLTNWILPGCEKPLNPN